MQTKLKRTLALILAVIMITGIMPLSVFANSSETNGEKNTQEEEYWKTSLEQLDWAEEFKKESYNWKLGKDQKIIRTSSADPLTMADLHYMGQYLDGNGRTIIRLQLKLTFTAPSGIWHSAEMRFDEKLRDLIDFNESAVYNFSNEKITFPNPDSNGVFSFGKDVLIEGNNRFLGYGAGRMGHAYDIPVEIVLRDGKSIADLESATKGRDSYVQLRITDNAHKRVYCRAYGDMPTDYSRYTLTAGIPVTDNSPSIFRKGEAISQGSGDLTKLFVRLANLSADYNDVRILDKDDNRKYHTSLSFQYSQRKDTVEDILTQVGDQGYKYGLAYIFDPVLLDFLKLPEDPTSTTQIGELKMYGDNGKFSSGIVVPINYGNITLLDGQGRPVTDRAQAKRAMVILKHDSNGLDLPTEYNSINVPDKQWNSGVISSNGNSHTRLNWYIDIDKMEDYVNNATGASGGARYLNLNVNAGLLVENPNKWTDYVAETTEDLVINRQGFYITELSEPLVTSPNTRNNQINIFFGSYENQKVENYGLYAGSHALGEGFNNRTEGIQYGGPNNRFFSTKRAGNRATKDVGMLRFGRTVKAGDSIKVSLPNKTNYNGTVTMYTVSPDKDAYNNRIYAFPYDGDPTKVWVGAPVDDENKANKLVIKYSDEKGTLQTIEAKQFNGLRRKWEATKGSFAWASGRDFAFNPIAGSETRGVELDITKSNWATDATVEFYENSTKLGTVTLKKLPLDFQKQEEQYELPTFAYRSDAETPILIGKADYLPKQDLVFDDSKEIKGYSRFQKAHVMLNLETLAEENNPSEKKTFNATSAFDTYDEEGELVANESHGEDIVFNDRTYRAFPYTLMESAEDKSDFADIKKRKDMPLYFSNNNSASLQSDSKLERVHSKVTFDLKGGKVATDKASLVPRTMETQNVVRIVPDNIYYLNNTKYDTEQKKLVELPEGEEYKPNGFTGDNVQFIDQDTGEAYPEDSNEKKLRTMLADEDITLESNDGRTLLGWSTKDGVSLDEWNKMEEATSLDQVNDETKAFKFTDKTPVDRSITVYAVYGKPAIRLHSNFDKDGGAEGLQEDVIVQPLSDEASIELQKGSPATEITEKLQSVYDKFKRDGYSLVGFSRDPNATEPDKNETGEALAKDLYLRDGDVFHLADRENGYDFDATEGLDLYAVWKKDFTVKASKSWFNTQDQALTDTDKYDGKFKLALIGRPAVGTAGNEVVVEGATYQPIQGTIKEYHGQEIIWDNIKGYDRMGRRMSYLVVELANDTAEKAFIDGSANWTDYGIKITEADLENNVYGHKDQVVEIGEADQIDTFTAATSRLHKTEANPDGVNPHGSGERPGYFDTTGYVFEVKNKELNIAPPTIEQAYDDESRILVNPPKEMVDKLTVTLPDNTTAIFKKDAGGETYLATKEGTTTKALSVENGKLIIDNGAPLRKDDVYKAVSEKTVADQVHTSEEATMTVKPRLTSTPPIIEKQGKLTEDNKVPVEFKIIDPITNRPVAGTTYQVVVVEGDGTERPAGDVFELTKDNANTFPNSGATILVPKDQLQHGSTIKIVAKEPDKKPSDSNILTIDLQGPIITPSYNPDLWRRWTDVLVELDEKIDDNTPVRITYNKDGVANSIDFDEKVAEKYVFKELAYDPTVTDLKVVAVDEFGNEGSRKIKLPRVELTKIRIVSAKSGRNFLIVSTEEDNTRIVATVYPEGTNLDKYTRDEYLSLNDPALPAPKATAEIENPTPGKKSVIRFKTPDGETYKLKKGDVLDVVGTVGTKGEEGYKRSNPYTQVIK